MDIDEVAISTLRVDDVKIAVRLEWGELRKVIKTIGAAENNGAVMDGVTAALKKFVIGVEGLTKGGKPFVWSAEACDGLPPWFVQDIFKALCNVADAPRDADPLAVGKQPPST